MDLLQDQDFLLREFKDGLRLPVSSSSQEMQQEFHWIHRGKYPLAGVLFHRPRIRFETSHSGRQLRYLCVVFR